MRKNIGKIHNPSEAKRHRRRLSIRSTLSGTSDCPRICPVKSNKHISVQVVDDVKGVTLFTVQTFGKNAVKEAGNNIEGAKLVGAKIAELLKSKKLETAVFDRAGYKYTGVVAAIADGIRAAGIKV